jgi:hypothetical protein
MKNYKKILYSLVAFAALASCDLDKVTSLEDSFEISVAAEPVLSKVSVIVYDAADGSGVDSNVDVSIVGADSDKIFTISGSKALNLANGFMILGVKRNTTVSTDNPITVTATFTADGYLPREREITFDGTDIREEQVSLLKRDNLPETQVLQTERQALSNNATSSEISVSMASNTNAEEITELTIAEGTTFEDEDGNPITGTNLQADFQTFDSQTPDVNEPVDPEQNPEVFNGGNNDFPGGLSIDGSTSAKSSNGKFYNLSEKNSLTQSYLIPITSLGCYYLFVDGRRVYRFSTPMLVRNYVYRNARNPETGELVKDGDIVSVYYNSTSNGVREKLADVAIQSDARGKYVEFQAPRAGVYPVGFERSFNHSCTSINSVKFQNDGKRSFFFYSVAPKSNPDRAIRYGYMYFDGIYEVTNSNINRWSNRALNFLGDDMIIKIYSYNRATRRYEVVYDEEISVCELDGQTINITNSECFEERDFNLVLPCPDATYILNNVYVYFKAENDRYWGYFDNIRNGKLDGKSPCFESGVKYQFGFYYDGWRTTPPLTEEQMNNLYENLDIAAICNAI